MNTLLCLVTICIVINVLILFGFIFMFILFVNVCNDDAYVKEKKKLKRENDRLRHLLKTIAPLYYKSYKELEDDKELNL